MWGSAFVSDVVFSSSVDQLLETAWHVCFPLIVLVRRAAGCMYGLSSRNSEFAVVLFEPAVLPEQRYFGRIVPEWCDACEVC